MNNTLLIIIFSMFFGLNMGAMLSAMDNHDRLWTLMYLFGCFVSGMLVFLLIIAPQSL